MTTEDAVSAARAEVINACQHNPYADRTNEAALDALIAAAEQRGRESVRHLLEDEVRLAQMLRDERDAAVARAEQAEAEVARLREASGTFVTAVREQAAPRECAWLRINLHPAFKAIDAALDATQEAARDG